jgi:hydroxymethylpyrimidine pyrophosphatase-like HAD family hydrolase
MQNKLTGLRNAGHCLGIVGGGTFLKIRQQLDDSFELFDHVFSECGCLYHFKNVLQYVKNIKEHLSTKLSNKHCCIFQTFLIYFVVI